VHDRLQQLYAETGAWRELANLALGDARASGDVAERFAYLLRAGSVFLEKAKDPEAALAALEEARALRPADAECVGLLVDALIPLGRAAEAVTLLDQILAPVKGRRSRELAPFHARLARAAQQTGDGPGEIRSLVQAFECDPQNGSVCSAVAARAMELNQPDLANRALRAVTLLKTPGPMSKGRAYQYMGELAEKSGDSKRALMLLKRALVEDAGLERARDLVDAIENRPS
jgi:tetratricopeptide (TPR) repeat protein